MPTLHLTSRSVTIRPSAFNAGELDVDIHDPTGEWGKKQVAAFLAVTIRCVDNWMKLKKNPLPYRIVGQSVRFNPAEVNAWKNSRPSRRKGS